MRIFLKPGASRTLAVLPVVLGVFGLLGIPIVHSEEALPSLLTLEPGTAQRATEKASVYIISARVWPSGLSEVVWYSGYGGVRAVSNVDFALLPQLIGFSKDGVSFSFLNLAVPVSGPFPDDWPAKTDLPPVDEFKLFVTGWDGRNGGESGERYYTALELLHEYVGQNRQILQQRAVVEKEEAVEKVAMKEHAREELAATILRQGRSPSLIGVDHKRTEGGKVVDFDKVAIPRRLNFLSTPR